MSFFDGIQTDGLEQEQDFVGGGSQPLDSDIYEATIKVAYLQNSASSPSKSVVLVADIDGREYSETLWYLSRNGVNYYERDGKKRPLMGYTVINDICFVTTEKELTEQKVDNRIIEVYDFDLKERTKKEFPVLVGLTGKKVNLAILNNLENKTKADSSGVYVPVAESFNRNAIDKVMHNPTGKTVNEARAGKDASFAEKWLKRNKGEVRDRRSIKQDAPQSSAAKPARQSLFS